MYLNHWGILGLFQSFHQTLCRTTYLYQVLFVYSGVNTPPHCQSGYHFLGSLHTRTGHIAERLCCRTIWPQSLNRVPCLLSFDRYQLELSQVLTEKKDWRWISYLICHDSFQEHNENLTIHVSFWVIIGEFTIIYINITT